METNYRIVHINYEVDGYHFDAAVDCNWFIHCYSADEVGEHRVAIELYCYTEPDWDIRMVIQDCHNSEHQTFVDWANIIEETKKWIAENTK